MAKSMDHPVSSCLAPKVVGENGLTNVDGNNSPENEQDLIVADSSPDARSELGGGGSVPFCPQNY